VLKLTGFFAAACRFHRGRLWQSGGGGVLEGSSSARMTPRYSPGYPVPKEWNHLVLHITNRLKLYIYIKKLGQFYVNFAMPSIERILR